MTLSCGLACCANSPGANGRRKVPRLTRRGVVTPLPPPPPPPPPTRGEGDADVLPKTVEPRGKFCDARLLGDFQATLERELLPESETCEPPPAPSDSLPPRLLLVLRVSNVSLGPQCTEEVRCAVDMELVGENEDTEGEAEGSNERLNGSISDIAYAYDMCI